MKKSVLALLITVIFFIYFVCSSFFNVKVYANTNANANVDMNNHMDAVLIFDTSGSMLDNDPKRIAIDGIKLFIDMLESKGSRVGVVGFSNGISFSIPLTEINSFEDKQKLITKMNDIEYVGATDLGLAMKEAEKMLFSSAKSGRNPLMVLFTDGYIEVSVHSTNRTNEQSLADLNQVLLGAKNKYPIYTIGLNSTGRVDEPLLNRIANETNAKNYMTTVPEILPEIFNEIFARYIKSNIIHIGTIETDGQNYNLIDINIPNNSVSEANIVLLSSEKLIDAIIVDPTGKEYSVYKDRTFYFSSTSKYSMIKIVKPQKGDWLLKVKGVKGDKVKINLLYNYEIQLEAVIANPSAIKGDTIEVIGRLMNETDYLNDIDLISAFNAELEIYDANKTLIDKKPMTLVKDQFVGKYELPTTESSLFFKINAAGAGFYRESNMLSFTIENNPPEKTKEIGSITFFHFPLGFKTKTIDLSTYFSDPDGDALTYTSTLQTPGKNIKLTHTADQFLLTPSNPFSFGSEKITVRASDSGKDFVEIDFSVSLFSVSALVLIILLFVACFVLILYIKTQVSRPMLRGKLKCTLFIGGIQEKPLMTELTLLGKKADLSKCVRTDNADISLAGLEKITFTQMQGRYVLKFVNNSSFPIFKLAKLESRFALEQNGVIVIKDEAQHFEIRCTYME